jgi:putative peptidoglycan lipid II flippase
MIKKIINRELSSVTSAAFIIAIATLASKFLGIFRDGILANRFPTVDLDVYYAAFRIPDFIFNVIVLGALSAGFIPVFAKLVARDKKEEAFKAANNILNILLIILSILTLVSIIISPQIIELITPGFDEEKKQRTIELTRIMFLSPIFMLLSSITGGILQSYKRFFIYSLSPIVYNLGIIFGAEFLALEFGLEGLAWGVVLGSFLQFIIQFPTVKMLGFRYKLIVDTKSREVRKIIRIMIPRIFTLIISQINLLIITVIASTLVAGSLTVFNFASNLQSFPLGIFAISFAVACFPTLSELSDEDQRDRFSDILLSTAKQILYFVIPISVLLVVLRAQIVRVILGHGYFGWEQTIMTFNVLQIFCFSLFAQALIPLFSRAFWAIHDSKTPFFSALFSATINIILAIKLSQDFGIYGLVGAFSISSIINALTLFILLKRKMGHQNYKDFYVTTAKISIASVLSGMIAYKVLYAIEPFLDTHTFIGIFSQGMLAGLVGLGFFLLFSWIIKIEEFNKFRSAFQRKLFKTKIKTSEIIPEEQ